MRVGWVNDYAPGEHPGGSLATQMRAIEAMEAAGHEIVFCTPHAVYTDCEIYVVNNGTLFSMEQLDFLIGAPHIMWLHDLWVTPQVWQIKKRYVINLLQSAERVAFLSRTHKDAFLMHHTARVRRNRQKLIPAMVDPTPFMSLAVLPQEERLFDAFWMGTFDRYRNPRQAMEWAEENKTQVDFYGFGKAPDYLSRSEYCRVVGPVDADKVPALMATYKVCVLFPSTMGDWNDPRNPPYVEACGRIAIEAILAGCALATNDRLGVVSYNWFKREREGVEQAMHNAPRLFVSMFESGAKGVVHGKS